MTTSTAFPDASVSAPVQATLVLVEDDTDSAEQDVTGVPPISTEAVKLGVEEPAVR
jgi:hypothetical protein